MRASRRDIRDRPAGPSPAALAVAGLALGAGWLVRRTELARRHTAARVSASETEAAPRASEEQLRLALAMTAMDAWPWHAPTGKLESRNIEQLYGWAPGSFDGNYATYLASVHPDDRARVAVADATTAATGGDYDLDFRIVWPDGSVRWMAERGGRVTERDAEGRAVRVIGTTLDVTDRKEAEAALRAREEEFRLLFAANPHST